MKVVLISNLNLEPVAEKLHSSPGLTAVEAGRIADEFNKDISDYDTYYAVAKPDDYVLWRGMADLVGEPDEINDLGNNKAMQAQMDALAKDHDENSPQQ